MHGKTLTIFITKLYNIYDWKSDMVYSIDLIYYYTNNEHQLRICNLRQSCRIFKYKDKVYGYSEYIDNHFHGIDLHSDMESNKIYFIHYYNRGKPYKMLSSVSKYNIKL